MVLAAAAAACSRADRGAAAASQNRPDYLADVPVLAGSVIYDVTSTPDAQHRGMRLRWPMDSVAAYYRRLLPTQGWQLVSDVADRASVSLYLKKADRFLWVQIHRTDSLMTDFAFTAAPQAAETPQPGAPR
jgi:hypothetical protein